MIEKMKLGDPEAWDCFYELWFPRFLKKGIQAGFDEDTAKDLAQDACLRIFEKISTCRNTSEGQTRSWIWTIHRNLISDFGRKNTVVCQFTGRKTRLLELTDVYQDKKNIEADFLIEEERLNVRTYLRKLKPEQQELIINRFEQGKEVKDIAKALGKQPSTISTAIKNALATLRACIEEE